MNIQCAHDELVELHKLQTNPKNPNQHPEKQIEMLAKIIDYQGQRAPIVVSNRSGFITKGHGRLEAIKQLGWERCAVDFQDYDNEAQEYADMVADNKIAELAHTDMDMVHHSIDELEIEEIELLGIHVIDDWDADDDSVEKSGEHLEGIDATIKVTCPQDLKDEVLIYLKAKLMETSFEGVHVR